MNTDKILATFFIFVILLSLHPNLKAQDGIVSNIQITLDIETKTRVQVEYPGIAEVIFTMANETIKLNKIKVLSENNVIKEYAISKDLIGIDKQDYDDYTMLKSAPEHTPTLGEERMAEIRSKVEKAEHSEKVWIDTQRIFGNDFVAGNKKTVNIVFEFDYEGQKIEISKDLTIEVLPPLPQIPLFETNQKGEIVVSAVPAGTGWYNGDLHVHSTFTDCDWPVNGNYNIWERRVQAMNAGMKWISVTDHGYCMSSPEWNSMKSEADYYTDNLFVVMPSEEFSVKEDTPSSSTEEPLCLQNPYPCYGTGAHLGAHNLTSWIGNQAGTCTGDYGTYSTYRCPSGPGSQQGINQVNSNNSYNFSIIDHPSPEPSQWGYGVLWDWDSLNVTGETGIEIWNGDWNASVQRAINIWKSKLVLGEHVFAFGGSDAEPGSIPTEGVQNGVYVPGLLNSGYSDIYRRQLLATALKQGHSYVTNGPALAMWAYPTGTSPNYIANMMGSTISVNAGQQVEIKVYVDSYLANWGYVYLYKGTIGGSESYYDYRYVSGYGNVYFWDTPSQSSYYRAEFYPGNGNYRAFTNPVWVNVVAQTLYIPYVVDTTAFRTNVAIGNYGASPANATVYFYRPNGVLEAQRPFPSVPSHGYTQIGNIIRWVKSVSGQTNLSGYLKIETDSTDVYALGSQNDNVSNDPSATLGKTISQAFTDGLIPVVCNIGTSWNSFVVINNMSDSATNITLTFYDEYGVQTGNPYTISNLVAWGQWSAQDIGATMGLPNNVKGMLKISSNWPVFASVRGYTQQNTGAFLEGIPDSASALDLMITYVVDTSAQRTNLAVGNIGGGTASVTLTFHNPDGTVNASRSDTVNANAYKQWGNFIRWIRNQGETSPTNLEGYVKIVSTQPIYVVGSQNDNVSNDPSAALGKTYSEAYTNGIIPVVLNQGTSWNSFVVIDNIGWGTNVTLIAYNFDGSYVNAITPYLCNGCQWSAQDIGATMGLSEGFCGMLVIYSNQPVLAAVRGYTAQNTGAYLDGFGIV